MRFLNRMCTKSTCGVFLACAHCVQPSGGALQSMLAALAKYAMDHGQAVAVWQQSKSGEQILIQVLCWLYTELFMGTNL